MTNWASALCCENVRRTHIISLVFEYVKIKADKCLRTYYKLSWKYVNTTEIISKVTITLSLINSKKDFDFVSWVIKNWIEIENFIYPRNPFTTKWYSKEPCFIQHTSWLEGWSSQLQANLHTFYNRQTLWKSYL